MAEESCIVAVGADFRRVEAALVDTSGRLVHIESAALPVVPRGGREYIDPAALFGIAAGAIHELLERKPREARRVIGLSVIGRSTSVVPVTSGGATSPFSFPPADGGPHLPADVPWDGIHDAVGLTRRRCEIPAAMRALARGEGIFLTPKDYLKWALTGTFSTDSLDAQRTYLWDLSKRAWSEELCGIFGVDVKRLPPVLSAADVVGAITASASKATGLKEGLPVACGMGDWGEYLGAGAFDVGDAFEHIGATGALYGVTDKRPRRELGLDTRPHIADGRYLVGREGLPGGACLEWFLAGTYFSRGGEIDWKAVDEELEAIAAIGKPENVLFFPALGTDNALISDGAFLNLRMQDNLASLIQGMIEGLFFSIKSVAEEVKRMSWELKAVYTTGKVAFKHAPRRMRANIYGARLYAGRRSGANVTSAAIVGAAAFGAFRTVPEAREAMLDIDGGVGPVEDARRLYEGHFASWAGTRDFLTSAR